ncbi:MAG: hypothetical protein NZL91_05390 [Thermoflexales bacterium]|nr:hypothetical protein [Thermoflexales bacterium]MCS7324838.1 hypothetical protein [Thermoflexales bacterium]MCX7938080.1 hypothetical protein [Thermoflexales bacterium]MDW8054932.1 hypothetical protein [Anaerolineae bacterium]MDW8396399.1 hypothetical protein [Anaerolineae bacterium]
MTRALCFLRMHRIGHRRVTVQRSLRQHVGQRCNRVAGCPCACHRLCAGIVPVCAASTTASLSRSALAARSAVKPLPETALNAGKRQ